MPALWTAEAVAEILQTDVGVWQASGISIDSRTLSQGDLFVAIKGENFDGKQFIQDAFAKGAVAAISEAGGEGIIQVEDCQKALMALAAAARARSSAKICAITGSVGKTSVKDSLAHMLNAHASEASYNNHWGVPLSLARMPAETTTAVFEIGMNHAGEISPLAKLLAPDLVIITHTAPAHLEFFDSINEIATAKAEIFDGLKHDGMVVLNRDDAFYNFYVAPAQAKAARIASFGSHAESDAQLISMRYHNDGADVKAKIFGTAITFSLFIPAPALALNALAVLTATHLLGGDISHAANQFAAIRPTQGHGDRQTITIGENQIILIDESYNANPASMKAALESLGHLPAKRRIAVLGDMEELGTDTIQFHQDLLPSVRENVDCLFACGKKMKYLYDQMPQANQGAWSNSIDTITTALKKELQQGDSLMIKASKAIGLDRLIRQLKEHT